MQRVPAGRHRLRCPVPAAICLIDLPPARSSTLPDCVATTVLPHSDIDRENIRLVAVGDGEPSLVVMLADMPAGFETRTRPAFEHGREPVSVKLSFRLDSGNTSTRPSLPRLTTALLTLAPW